MLITKRFIRIGIIILAVAFISALYLCRNLFLLAACRYGNLTTVKILLDVDNSLLKSNNGSSSTPIGLATINDHADIVQYLLAHGADPNISDKYGAAPLHIAVTRSNLTLIKMLLENGADPNQPCGKELLSPLQLIVRYHSSNSLGYSIAEYIIQHGAVIDDGDKNGFTALHWAVNKSDWGMTILLIRSGADVNAHDNLMGDTPLFIVADKSIAQILIKHGADVNARNFTHETPLINQALRGNFELVQLLLMNHAKVNGQNKGGITALHWAANESIAKLLIKQGANPYLKTDNDLTALECAKIGNRNSTYRYLFRLSQRGGR